MMNNFENMKLTNFNNRVYSKEIFNDLVKRSKEFTLYGELFDRTKNNFGDIQLKYVSHIIENLEIYDDGIYGDIKILETPSGNLIKNYNYDSDELQISERSYGIVENGVVNVSHVITYDIIPYENNELLLRRRIKKIDKIKKIINDRKEMGN